MEEKAEFHYQGEYRLNSGQMPEFNRVLLMSNLQPMSVQWEDVELNQHTTIFHLDFLNEIVYDRMFKNASQSALGEAILQILREKKQEAMKPIFPEGYVESILGNKNQIFEKRPDARKYQS